MQGIVKKEWNDGTIKWGQWKNGKMEGYVTEKNKYGIVGYHQYKNNEINGYAIRKYYDGLYQGEYKDAMHQGFGIIKHPNNDEYDGQWKY